MNIFDEIAGLDGEDLVTALLRVLLLRSQEIREAFVGLISDSAHFGPIELRSHFSCVIQHSTRDDAVAGSGRLDLKIETDDAVIGIENKLFAPFQTRQPQKYLQSMAQSAVDLANVRSGKYMHYVVVVAPSSRRSDVEQRIGSDPHLMLITWDQVLQKLESASSTYDPLTKFIALSFLEFVRDRVAFIPKFEAWVPHLQRRFEPGGSVLQRRVLQEIKTMLPAPGAKLGTGHDWAGYYFCRDQSNHAAWCGYLPKEGQLLSGGRNNAELVIVTSFPLTLPSADFREVEMCNPKFLNRPYPRLYAWAIEYDAAWNSPERWRRAFAPINEQAPKIDESAEGSA